MRNHRVFPPSVTPPIPASPTLGTSRLAGHWPSGPGRPGPAADRPGDWGARPWPRRPPAAPRRCGPGWPASDRVSRRWPRCRRGGGSARGSSAGRKNLPSSHSKVVRPPRPVMAGLPGPKYPASKVASISHCPISTSRRSSDAGRSAGTSPGRPRGCPASGHGAGWWPPSCGSFRFGSRGLGVPGRARGRQRRELPTGMNRTMRIRERAARLQNRTARDRRGAQAS